MKPERRSHQLLSITQSKAKMYEYRVPEEYHIDIPRDPARLFTLAIGLLGDYASALNKNSLNDNFQDLNSALNFSSRFFDAYFQTHLNTEMNPYLLLLGSASYYLCDLPGSSHVLANMVDEKPLELECVGLEELLLWILKGDYSSPIDSAERFYNDDVEAITQFLTAYFSEGRTEDELEEITSRLLSKAYLHGTPRQLLFADVVCAIVNKRYKNSSRYSLPRYSELPVDDWLPALQKEGFIKELWPAQHLIGQWGVYRGSSAIIQMPTSAGKTKAIDIIIRSAIQANRTALTIIVAPFRALCHEIRTNLYESFINEPVYIDELTDLLQAEFEIESLLGRNQVLVLTPEKLVYILRHSPELAGNIDLLIFDEGHQFDSGIRGITFELLLASLKEFIPENAQTILISAVISNATSVGDWLIGENSLVISGKNLLPTYRSLGFTSWADRLGRLEFVSLDDPDNKLFFVPRIIEQHQLQSKPRERKKRLFPEKDNGNAISLYLSLLMKR